MPDPTTVALAMSKLIGLGVSAWHAYKNDGLGEDELKTLQALVDTGLGLGALRKDETSRTIAARHFALATRAFGEAFRRSWYGDEHFAPGSGWMVWLRQDERGRARMEQIEARTRIAASKLLEAGARPAPEELRLLDALVGDPLNTSYYRKLWSAFSDPSLLAPGEEPLVLPGEKLQFERHMRLAYAEGLSSAQGEEIRRYLVSLGEHRAELVRELLLRDMAAWGGRHVFGNVAEHADLPLLPLGGMYVEPDARSARDSIELAPVLTHLERLIEEHRVVVLQADFGHGKSLTARMLAWRKAQEYLSDPKPTPACFRPLFVKCAEDFQSHSDPLGKVIRRAALRHANSLKPKLDLAIHDPVFNETDAHHRTLVLVDGLDEVALGDQEVKDLFRQMQEQASKTRRFVVFSRPAALRHGDHLNGIPVLDLQPLQTTDEHGALGGQVAAWLSRWNSFTERKEPITVEAIATRGLLELSKTPILLFMIASTWDKQISSDPSRAELYELFFQQIARGKYEKDTDKNRPIADASERLLKKLQSKELRYLPSEAKPPEAMLWLMGRVAWKAKCLEDAEWLDGREEALDEIHVRGILREELHMMEEARAEQAIQLGLLLALQANLEQGTRRILFGHKSFREFLIGRYWASRLRYLLEEKEEREWEFETKEPLLQGRLLGREDESFVFFRELVVRWPDSERKQLQRWAQRCFDDERMINGARSFREDRRPLLREAALAIGSALRKGEGVAAKGPQTLRSMLAWFWLREVLPLVLAPGFQGASSKLNYTFLYEADLSGANLSRADLSRVDLVGADLSGANLSRAALSRAALRGANLSGARLIKADLIGASLSRANLRGAALGDACLSDVDLNRANLSRAALRGASLRGANLSGARLIKANLRGADLSGANLSGARLIKANLSGANLSGAVLSRASLSGANLSGANLTGTRLRKADLRQAILTDAQIDPELLREALT